MDLQERNRKQEQWIVSPLRIDLGMVRRQLFERDLMLK